MVRMETGVEVRDADVELLELPSSTSKRGLYKRYMSERGYKAETDHKGPAAPRSHKNGISAYPGNRHPFDLANLNGEIRT